MSNRRPLETIRGAFKSGQRAKNDRVHHCVILITQFRNPYAPDLLAAYGLWGSRMRQSVKEALADAKRERDEANTRAGEAWKSGYKEGGDHAIAQARKAIS